MQWYQKLNRYEECLIERHESFIKQTYRNRMIIPTTNGPLSLTIPTNHGTSLAMKDIRISDHANWRHVHWNALLSAYGESPFFEYYQDDIRPFYEKKYEFLFDFNMEIMEKMIELLDIRPKVSVTDRYVLSEERRMKSFLSEEGRVKSEEFNSSSAIYIQPIKEIEKKERERQPNTFLAVALVLLFISRHIIMDYTYNLRSIHIYLLILNSNKKMFNPFITSSIMPMPPLSSHRYFDGLPRS